MTADPFPGRCRKCGTALMETDADDCGRGDQCRGDLARLGDWIARGCSAVLRGARRMGLIE